MHRRLHETRPTSPSDTGERSPGSQSGSPPHSFDLVRRQAAQNQHAHEGSFQLDRPQPESSSHPESRPRETISLPEEKIKSQSLWAEAWSSRQYLPDAFAGQVSPQQIAVMPLEELRSMRLVLETCSPAQLNQHLMTLDENRERLRNEYRHVPRTSSYDMSPEGEDRDRQRKELGKQKEIFTRKKAYIFNVLERKAERGELPREHNEYYIREKKMQLLGQNGMEMHKMENRHEAKREKLWREGVDSSLFPEMDMKLYPEEATRLLTRWFPEEMEQFTQEKHNLEQRHEEQLKHFDQENPSTP